MKKNEKIFIVVIVLIAILAIIFAVNKNNSKQETAVPQAQAQAQTQTQNQGTTGQQATEKKEFTQELSNGVSLNTSSKLNSDKEYNGIKITGIQLTKTGNTSTIVANATNTTNTATTFQMLKLKLVDKSGNEIQTISCAIKALEPGETTQFSASASFDYVNAYDFEITK